MSWHVAKAAVQELLNESEDTLFGVGRKDPGLQGKGVRDLAAFGSLYGSG